MHVYLHVCCRHIHCLLANGLPSSAPRLCLSPGPQRLSAGKDADPKRRCYLDHSLNKSAEGRLPRFMMPHLTFLQILGGNQTISRGVLDLSSPANP